MTVANLYWWETERRIRFETLRDRQAAARVNADWLARNREPFGTVRVAQVVPLDAGQDAPR